MAETNSSAPTPFHAVDAPGNSGSMEAKGQDAKGETKDESSVKPILPVSESPREEYVQNAVKFLSHPKVRGSPVLHRRSFLERKGLTKEEIDEAFRLVPDPPSNVKSGEAVESNQAMLSNSYGSAKLEIPTQSSQLASGAVDAHSMIPRLKKSRFNWSQLLYAFGILAISGAGTLVLFKKKIFPWIKAWIKKVGGGNNDLKIGHKTQVTLSVEAAKAAASAAALVAQASQELLNAKTEERKYFVSIFGMLNSQLEQMKSMGRSIRNLESNRGFLYSQDKQPENFVQPKLWNGDTRNGWIDSEGKQLDPKLPSTVPKFLINGSQPMDLGLAKPSPAPLMEPVAAPFSKSYIEIMEMIQRGEKPPNIKEIDDRPPNPDQPISKPLLAPRSKPWEISQPAQLRPFNGFQTQASTQQGFSSNAFPVNGHSFPQQSPMVLPQEAAATNLAIQNTQIGDEKMTVFASREGYNVQTSEVILEPETYSSLTKRKEYEVGIEV